MGKEIENQKSKKNILFEIKLAKRNKGKAEYLLHKTMDAEKRLSLNKYILKMSEKIMKLNKNLNI